MAALLTFEMGDTDKVVEYIAECSDMGIEVTAPDINESGVDFTPLYKEDERQKRNDSFRAWRRSKASAKRQSSKSSSHAKKVGQIPELVPLLRKRRYAGREQTGNGIADKSGRIRPLGRQPRSNDGGASSGYGTRGRYADGQTQRPDAVLRPGRLSRITRRTTTACPTQTPGLSK